MSFRSIKRPKRANICILWPSKSEENMIHSYLKDSAFTAVKMDRVKF